MFRRPGLFGNDNSYKRGWVRYFRSLEGNVLDWPVQQSIQANVGSSVLKFGPFLVEKQAHSPAERRLHPRIWL